MVPKGLQHSVTRPSIDATPSAGPSSLDPTRLLPQDLRIKPPDENDLKRQKANVDSGLVDWLKDYRIPTNHQRLYASKNGKGTTALTAGCASISSIPPGRDSSTDHALDSNVQLVDLQQFYRWEFYSTIFKSGNASLEALGNIVPFKPLYLIESESLPVLEFPKDWQVRRCILMDVLTMSITMVSASKRD